MTITSGIDWSATSYDEVVRRHRWHIPELLNIAHICCDRHAAQTPDRIALVLDDTRTTFAQLKYESDRLAGAFAELGVDRGDRVAVLLPQCVENPLAHLATFKRGAVSVPLSPLFRADALRYRLAHSGAKVVVTDEEHRPYVDDARRSWNIDRAPPRVLVRDELRSLSSAAVPVSCTTTRADDPAMLIYTSGTTGLPKGALHAHRAIPGRLPGFELIHRLEGGDDQERPFFTPADWAWIGGLVDCVLTPWVFGLPVLGHARRDAFDAAAMLDLVERQRVRSLFLPPTAIHKLMTVERPSLRGIVRSVHTAGEPLSPTAYAWAREMFGTVYELYGMTEIGATIGSSPFFDVRPGAMGKPFPGHVVTLLNEDGTEVTRAGELGEIAVQRGDPGMFLGYLAERAGPGCPSIDPSIDDSATRDRFRGDWLVSGDLAARDDDGYFHYSGRGDDVFNTSGYRVGPTEIERTLVAHDAVAQAAVVGAPDAERGTVVKAFVVLKASCAPSSSIADELKAHVRARLATFEVPRVIVFARELPMTMSGKIRRNELRAADANARFGATT
jgi:acetyl-CoA synthetase